MAPDISMLINYGVLGAWTLYLLYEKKVLIKQMSDSLDNLAEAIRRYHGGNR